MTTKNVNIKIDEMKTNTGLIKNLELSIGKVVNDNWTEPMGPTPMPSLDYPARLGHEASKQDTSHFTCLIVTFAVFALLENAI